MKQTTHILNSAMMPLAGTYNIRSITPERFFQEIEEQHEEAPDKLRSWIGYQQNADIIEHHTGISVRITRENTWLKHGDRLLIMRLRYRTDSARKGQKVDKASFEYFEGNYIETNPVPAWHDLMSMDIFEPDGQRFLKDLYLLTGGEAWALLERTRALMAETDDLKDWKEHADQYMELLKMHFDFKRYLGQFKFDG